MKKIRERNQTAIIENQNGSDRELSLAAKGQLPNTSTTMSKRLSSLAKKRPKTTVGMTGRRKSMHK